MGVVSYKIKVGSESGTFFVEEEMLGSNYTARWTAATSYGLYGHYWDSMGAPFAEFLKRVGSDYVLNKISSTVRSADVFRRSLDKWIKNSDLPLNKKHSALRRVEYWMGTYAGERAIDAVMEDKGMVKFEIPWEELVYEDYPEAAKGFMRVLWPEFVRVVTTQQGEPVEERSSIT